MNLSNPNFNDDRTSDKKESHSMNSPFADSKKRTALAQYTGAGVIVLLGLFVVSRYNFLLFQGIAELFSIAVAWSVFFLVWNTKRIARNDALLAISIAILFLTSVTQAHASTVTAQSPLPHQTQKETLIVGSEQNYPPFATGMVDADAGGFTVELWKAVAAEAGLSYAIRVIIRGHLT